MLKRRFLGIFSAKKLVLSEKLPTFAPSFRDTWAISNQLQRPETKILTTSFPIIHQILKLSSIMLRKDSIFQTIL